MHRLVVVALGLTLLGSVGFVGVAHAGSPPGPPYGNMDNFGWTTGQGVGATASTPGTSVGVAPLSTGSTGGAAPVCTYAALSSQDSVAADDMAAQGWGPAKGSGPGAWYRRVCGIDAQGDTIGTVVWLGKAPAAAVDPAALAERALGFTPLGAPGIRLNPPADRNQLVGVITWLWISGGWSALSASASAGGVAVTTTATPEQVTWDMGDGHTVVCSGPGTPYDPSRPDATPSCSYTYSSSSAGQPGGTYTITVTESWAVAWTARGRPPGASAGGTLPAVTRSARLPVRVGESQAINTGGSS
jgi:hypothetical protein